MSWFFKSGLAAGCFGRTPDGQVFTYPLGSGQSRVYRLSDAQAEELAARIKRSFSIGFAGALGVASLAVMFVVAATIMKMHSVGLWVGTAIFMLVAIALPLAVQQKATTSALAGVPWNIVPSERVTAVRVVLPTWFLVFLAVGAPVLFATTAIPAYKALASGQVNLNVLTAALFLVALSVAGGAVLVKKLRAKRSAQQ